METVKKYLPSKSSINKAKTGSGQIFEEIKDDKLHQYFDGLPLEFKRTMARIWQRLGASLGSKFTRVFGPVGGISYKLWSLQLREFNEYEIQMGIKRFMDSDEEFLDAKKLKGFCSNKTVQGNNWQAYMPFKKHTAIEDKDAQERNKRAAEFNIKYIRENLL